jgi:hypothetical protein
VTANYWQLPENWSTPNGQQAHFLSDKFNCYFKNSNLEDSMKMYEKVSN